MKATLNTKAMFNVRLIYRSLVELRIDNDQGDAIVVLLLEPAEAVDLADDLSRVASVIYEHKGSGS